MKPSACVLSMFSLYSTKRQNWWGESVGHPFSAPALRPPLPALPSLHLRLFLCNWQDLGQKTVHGLLVQHNAAGLIGRVCPPAVYPRCRPYSVFACSLHMTRNEMALWSHFKSQAHMDQWNTDAVVTNVRILDSL